jgi:hypothetical protein
MREHGLVANLEDLGEAFELTALTPLHDRPRAAGARSVVTVSEELAGVRDAPPTLASGSRPQARPRLSKRATRAKSRYGAASALALSSAVRLGHAH